MTTGLSGRRSAGIGPEIGRRLNWPTLVQTRRPSACQVRSTARLGHLWAPARPQVPHNRPTWAPTCPVATPRCSEPPNLGTYLPRCTPQVLGTAQPGHLPAPLHAPGARNRPTWAPTCPVARPGARNRPTWAPTCPVATPRRSQPPNLGTYLPRCTPRRSEPPNLGTYLPYCNTQALAIARLGQRFAPSKAPRPHNRPTRALGGAAAGERRAAAVMPSDFDVAGQPRRPTESI